jgi:hypothetical protein
MIKKSANGVSELSFDDWTEPMRQLSFEVSMLRPRWDGQHDCIHDLAIDRLSHMKHGPLMIELLYEHIKSGESGLVIRPDADELMALGLALKRVNLELDRLRQERQAKHYHLQEQKARQRRIA